ncbi:MAG: hypothetical protein L3K08_06925, partial [Thermoplasmata archaeon]|nr:hypothetical protein [Thermoplasmata archaeon]
MPLGPPTIGEIPIRRTGRTTIAIAPAMAAAEAPTVPQIAHAGTPVDAAVTGVGNGDSASVTDVIAPLTVKR